MKKVIFSIAIIFMASVTVVSQNADSHSVMYRLDSIIIEREGLPSSKETYLYNEYGKEILITRSSWNDTNHEWDEYTKIEYVYDTNKNSITEIGLFDDSWKTKNEWIYDTNKNITTHIKSYWNGSTNNWKEGEIVEYVYDANNKQIQVLYQNFIDRRKTKTQYLYNYRGEKIMKTQYKGNMVGVWKKDYKQEYAYDTNGNKIKETWYSWEKNAWKISRKEECLYNIGGDRIEDITYSLEKNILKKSWKTEYKYDETANIKSHIHYSWGENAWVIQNKWEYVYNNSGKKIMEQEYNWDEENNNWFIRSKTETDYDVYGNEVMYKHYYQNWGGNGLQTWGKSEYIYNLSYSKENLIMPQLCYYTELLENNIHLQIESWFCSKDDEKPHNVIKVLLFTSICEKK